MSNDSDWQSRVCLNKNLKSRSLDTEVLGLNFEKTVVWERIPTVDVKMAHR